MLGAIRRGALVALLAMGVAASAQATPLGLSPGDFVTSISIDSLSSPPGPGNPGDGASYDVNTSLLSSQGRINSLLASGNVLVPTGGTFEFDALFLNESLIDPFPVSPFRVGSANLGPTGSSPDFTLFENGNVILTGDFVSLTLSAFVNINLTTPQQVSAVGTVAFTGGDANLLNALGGMGGQANVLIDVTVGDFSPTLDVLAADNNIFNSNFDASFTGQLIPLMPAPFVPEPSTALLVGFGLAGMLGVARNREARRGRA